MADGHTWSGLPPALTVLDSDEFGIWQPRPGGGRKFRRISKSALAAALLRPPVDWDMTPVESPATLSAMTFPPSLPYSNAVAIAGDEFSVTATAPGLAPGAAQLGGTVPATPFWFAWQPMPPQIVSGELDLAQSAVGLTHDPFENDNVFTLVVMEDGLYAAHGLETPVLLDPGFQYGQVVLLSVDPDPESGQIYIDTPNTTYNAPISNVAGAVVGGQAFLATSSALPNIKLAALLHTSPDLLEGLALREGYAPMAGLTVSLPLCAPGDILVVRPVGGTFAGVPYQANRDGALVIDPATDFVLPIINGGNSGPLDSSDIENLSNVIGLNVTAALNRLWVDATNALAAAQNAEFTAGNAMNSAVLASQEANNAANAAQVAMQSAGEARVIGDNAWQAAEWAQTSANGAQQLANQAGNAAAAAQQTANAAIPQSALGVTVQTRSSTGFLDGGWTKNRYIVYSIWNENRADTRSGDVIMCDGTVTQIDVSAPGIPLGVPFKFMQVANEGTVVITMGDRVLGAMHQAFDVVAVEFVTNASVIGHSIPKMPSPVVVSSAMVDEMTYDQRRYIIYGYTGLPGSPTGILESIGVQEFYPAGMGVLQCLQRFKIPSGAKYERAKQGGVWSAWMEV